jgi:hypothetical protein
MRMKKPTIPSAQHLARVWQPTVAQTVATLIRLVENPPFFSYARLLPLIRDLVVLRTPLDQLNLAIRRSVKQEVVRNNYVELLSLIHAEFARRNVEFAQPVSGRKYPVSRELAVPFVPPLVYGAKGELVFPWFSLWHLNPLEGERLSLFVTLVNEMLMQDPDLENARFEIWDLSAPKPGEPRRLRIADARDVPLVSESRKVQMLSVFVEGFRLAREHFALRATPSSEQPRADAPQSDQSDDLFR